MAARWAARSVGLGILLYGGGAGASTDDVAPLGATTESRENKQYAQVALVDFPEGDPLYLQLKVELKAMGFLLVPLSDSGNALIVRRLSYRELEVVLADESRLRMVRPKDLPERLFAIRVAEQVRASLLLSEVEVPREEEPLSVPVQEPRQPKRPAKKTAPQIFSLSVEGLAEFGAGGLGTPARVAFAPTVWPQKWWGIGAFAHLPLGSQRVASGGAVAEVTSYSFGVGPNFRALLLPRFVANAGFGVGGSVVVMDGAATPPLLGVRDTVTPALFYVSAGANLLISRNVFLRFSALGSITTPQVTVNFPDGEAANRQAALALGGGLGVSF